MTVGDLQQMKRDGKKIAVAVVYEHNMTKICEKAGVDLLSVGDSLGRYFLGHATPDDTTVEDIVPFARAVARAAERAVVNVDMPRPTCMAGPKEVEKAARLYKEAGADSAKVDIRGHEEELLDEIHATIEAGLASYPQIGFATFELERNGRHGSPAEHDYILKWANAVQDAGASMLDLSMTSAEIYADVCRGLRIPVLNGPAVPEADGKILSIYGASGYWISSMDQTARPSAARYIYDVAKQTIDDIHAGKWESR
ncbi:MAG: 3-methyl-2-oxobutanoate hydroxymethyltransferase [Chloroflexi bacterium]|nr:3-methyl-2-oxobutanoate hydroxymethyltransferase [Chloroflexota bacterium]